MFTPSERFLHHPMSVEGLDDLETHLRISTYLARALWLALQSDHVDMGDPRDSEALVQLADVVAHHASAANYLFHSKSSDAPGAET